MALFAVAGWLSSAFSVATHGEAQATTQSRE